MKILDRYILSTYLKSFFSVFAILMLIFLLQSVWVYIAELAGKDLDINIIFKFLLYVSPRIVVLVLPLTVLLVSIMVFGNFAENYEFAAMKSTGISLQRAMKSLSIFIFLLSIVSFFFANNVIPLAEYNFFNLRRNIARVKPAMAIAEGQFNQLKDINIKVAKKNGNNGQYLKDVIIHQKKGNTFGNYTVIKSNNGEFISDEKSNVLQLILYDGNYYDELQPANYKKRTKNRPLIKSTFDKYVINIDISDFNNVDFEKKDASARYNMLGIVELNKTIDSLYRLVDESNVSFSNKMLLKSKRKNPIKTYNSESTDSTEINDVLELFNQNKKIELLNYGLNSIKNTKEDIKVKSRSVQIATTNINKHIIAFHDKFALGLMCIVLFFVGAPLGALIRKGGVGLPMVIAILIFLTYHFISIFAKNSSEDSSLNPVFATWLGGLIMLPFSIYLTNKATKDRALVDIDAIIIPLKKKLVKSPLPLDLNPKYSSSFNELRLSELRNSKLFDIIKNYHYYNLTEEDKNAALKEIKRRKINHSEIEILAMSNNEKYNTGLRYLKDYHENATIGVIAHILFLIFGIVGLILNFININVIGYLFIIISIFALILFLIIFPKILSNQSNFYKLLDKKFNNNNAIFIILSVLLFFLYRTYYNKKMREDLMKIN